MLNTISPYTLLLYLVIRFSLLTRSNALNYKRLETFVWVASLGSFRKAAERLHTTQPAISARIAGLEEELGVKLFEREGGPARLY